MLRIVWGLDEWIGIYHTDDVYVRGTWLDISAATANLAEINKVLTSCTGEYLGILFQDVTVAGQSFINKEMGVPDSPGVVALGQKVSIRQGHGKILTDVVVGYGETGDLTNAAHDSAISIFNGRLRVMQTGDIQIGRLIGTWGSNATPTAYYIQIY